VPHTYTAFEPSKAPPLHTLIQFKDISSLHTMQGPITKARARQLDLQVCSNIVNYFSELTLGFMHVLLIRNNGEDQQGLGEGQGVKEEELGRSHQGGVQVQLNFDSTSDSRI
jgi:hypothetical protein